MTDSAPNRIVFYCAIGLLLLVALLFAATAKGLRQLSGHSTYTADAQERSKLTEDRAREMVRKQEGVGLTVEEFEARYGAPTFGGNFLHYIVAENRGIMREKICMEAVPKDGRIWQLRMADH